MAGTATVERLQPASFEVGASFGEVLDRESYQPLTKSELPRAFLVSEMPQDKITVETASRFIAGVMLGNEVELSYEKPKINSLKEAVHLAASGDPDAIKMVFMNAKTDLVERALKAGHIMSETKLKVDEKGNIYQHGQTMESVQANALLYASNHPAIRRRSEAETRNSFRLKRICENSDILEDYYFFVPSLVADDMSDSDKKKAGFFTEAMSASLQFTTINEEGELVVVPAFWAGTVSAEAKPHDKETIVELGYALGVDWSGKSATEIIDSPVMIRKDLMPNGPIDIIRIMDGITAQNLNRSIFFGQARQSEDYAGFTDRCLERERGFDKEARQIAHELIAQAPNIQTEVQACRALNKISGRNLVDKAIEDHSIDARVLGDTAARHVLDGRFYQQMGQYERLRQAKESAYKTETSGSCPTSDEEVNNGLLGIDVYGFKEQGIEGYDKDEDDLGDRKFKCKHGHLNRRPERNKLIDKCQRNGCKAKVKC